MKKRGCAVEPGDSRAMVMLFYMVGPHENFYRNLKKYLKEGD